MSLVSFYTSENIRNQRFFYVLRGVWKKKVVWNGLKEWTRNPILILVVEIMKYSNTSFNGYLTFTNKNSNKRCFGFSWSKCVKFQLSVEFYTETWYLIFPGNLMTGFYRQYNTGLKMSWWAPINWCYMNFFQVIYYWSKVINGTDGSSGLVNFLNLYVKFFFFNFFSC